MDLRVRPQHPVLWDDDLGPETDVDNPEVPRDSRSESNQEVADGSSDSSEEEDEWNYVKGASKPEIKIETNDETDSKSQLNPNASEFFPGLEKFSGLDKDDFIAASPNVIKVSGHHLDDLEVPSESEFELDISTKACDLDPAADISDDFASALASNVSEKIESVDNKNEGIALILTPQRSEPHQSADTNPFASDMDNKAGEDDKVDFVQDYFGKSGLDFKPFESVTPQPSVEKMFDSDDLTGSHVSNSVSEEISSHFHFINSHLEAQSRPEESEKERNQLEIKEPESPAHSEGYGNGVTEKDHKDDQGFLVSRSAEVEISSIVTVSKESGMQGVTEFVCNISEKISEPTNLYFSSEDELRVCVEEGFELDNKTDTPKILEVSDFEDDKCVSDINTGTEGVISGSHSVGSSVKEESREIHQTDKHKENEVVNEFNDLKLEPSTVQLNLAEDTKIEETESNDNVLMDKESVTLSSHNNLDMYAVNSEYSGNSIHATTKEDVPPSTDFGKVNNADELFGFSSQEDQVENINTGKFSEENKESVDKDSNVGNKEFDHPGESQLELADTIGPNSFSFSQPYEVEVHGMAGANLINKYDVMSRSMHECLEQDSSFEFISESAVRETVVEENSSGNKDKGAETAMEIKLENGIGHVESQFSASPLNNGLGTENVKTESAIVESHEVPISSEPDLVFVEQICPTVEVRSDEASPVSKEVSSLEMTSVLSAAGVATALGTAAAATAAVIDQNKEETKDNKVTDAKPPTKPAAVKASATKKAASPATKPAVSKLAPKESLTKPATGSAKPKLSTLPKSASLGPSLAPKTKAAPLHVKSSSTTAGKPLGTKTTITAKPAPASTARVPSKTTAPPTKPAVSAAKTTTRPTSAPLKTSTSLSKPAAPSKPLTAASRAPATTVKKLPSASLKPSVGAKSTSTDSKVAAKPLSRTVSAPTTRPSVPKTASSTGAKPPVKLGLSSAPTSKPKATSPTKPAPIKAKSPLAAPKRPSSATAKKPSTVLDKNAKNAVKPVPKDAAQKEIIASETQNVQEDASATTTNGHHIENGNVTPLEEIPSHII